MRNDGEILGKDSKVNASKCRNNEVNMATSLKTVTVMKTRKAQACIWCGETIEAGTSCVSHIYIEDSQFCDDRFHPECDIACQTFYKQEQCWGEGFAPY